MGRERELMILVCKKWHVAKRLADGIRRIPDIPTIDYVFDEEGTPLPDLGGIQTTLEKRNRHRRALMRMLFDYHATDRLVICLDPKNIDLMEDFCSDRSVTRLLEIDCIFTDDYLIGHAKRVGLAVEHTSPETLARLLPTIRFDLRYESDQIRDASFEHVFQMREAATVDENAVSLAAFLVIAPEVARELAASEHLYSD